MPPLYLGRSTPAYSLMAAADFNDDLTPAINNPQSVAYQTLYMDTLKATGSSEWSNMMWFDVQQGFTTGQYGMVVDVGDFVPVYEGEGSKVAGKLGLCPPACWCGWQGYSSVWTWGFSMNAKTTGDQAKAAWLFIMWASSKDSMTSFAKTGSWPTRASVWEQPGSDRVCGTNLAMDHSERSSTWSWQKMLPGWLPR